MFFRRFGFMALLLYISFFVDVSAAQLTLKEALNKTNAIVYHSDKIVVNKTVATELCVEIVPHVKIIKMDTTDKISSKRIIKISILEEDFSKPPKVTSDHWMYFKMSKDGTGQLLTSHSHLMYTLFCLLKEEWLEKDIAEFTNGKIIIPKFEWLTGRDECFGWRKRFTKNYDPESSVREFARMGCSHVVVNSLAQPFPLTIHPPGEHYYRYYVSGPDFNQFVETELNQGIYPPEYLAANLDFMKKNVELAKKYGLRPGMHVANPRSVPETLFDRYPFLRGPRVDHPYRAYVPRYALSTAHPVVRWHYAEMLTKILKEIPEMEFISTWLNDSGSGMEFTTRLYPGRNGGPYLVREWRTDEEFIKAGAENVIRYYQVLRDAARKINPDFRIIAGIRAVPEEANIIMEGMGDGIDINVSPSDKANRKKWSKLEDLRGRGSFLRSKENLKINANVLGIPFPWLAASRLNTKLNADLNKIRASFDPPSLAPYDINRTILRAFQINSESDIDKVIRNQAAQWVGKKHSEDLVELWRLCDKAVAVFPGVPLYDGYGFVPDRLWVRPFVPDIGKISEKERAYYEKYILSTFNNSQNIDLNADMLWEVMTIEQADNVLKVCDEKVLPPLNVAIAKSKKAIGKQSGELNSKKVFIDLQDRLIAAHCYYRTLRNVSAWIAGVHGYINSTDQKEKDFRLKMVKEMVSDEIQNSKELLALWENSTIDFMPVFEHGETWFLFGSNFGELIKRKIELTEKYGDSIPYIDPNYKWRMPIQFQIDSKEYLKYEK